MGVSSFPSYGCMEQDLMNQPLYYVFNNMLFTVVERSDWTDGGPFHSQIKSHIQTWLLKYITL